MSSLRNSNFKWHFQKLLLIRIEIIRSTELHRELEIISKFRKLKQDTGCIMYHISVRRKLN